MRLRTIVSLAVLLLPFSACSQERRFTCTNSSMEPTLLKGEKFAVDTKAFGDQPPSRGDLIVFSHQDVLLLKRVVAVSGDRIEGKGLEILVNGKLIREDYIQHTGGASIPANSFLRTFPQATVSAGHIFVMGDNRDFSDDSRDPYFGTVPLKDVLGKAVRIVASNDSGREGSPLR